MDVIDGSPLTTLGRTTAYFHIVILLTVCAAADATRPLEAAVSFRGRRRRLQTRCRLRYGAVLWSSGAGKLLKNTVLPER